MLAVASLITSLLISVVAARATFECNPVIHPNKELLITDSRIVSSIDAREGSLSFGSMFKKFANQPDRKDLDSALNEWLAGWSLTRLNDGITPAVARSTEALRWIWPKTAEGKLDLKEAPFVLSAIVFRPDVDVLDGKLVTGELRFIYNLIKVADGSPLQFSAIFEFPIYESGSSGWLEAFHKLGSLPMDSSYLSEFKKLMSKMSSVGARLRTNDFYLAFVWDLREFKVAPSRKIELQRLPMTPALQWSDPDNMSRLTDWVGNHEHDIESGSWNLDAEFGSGNAFVPNEGFTWRLGSTVPESTRHRFSLQTCNGCHGGETMTRFSHVSPRGRTGRSEISNYLAQDLKIREEIFKAKLCGDQKSFSDLMASRTRQVH